MKQSISARIIYALLANEERDTISKGLTREELADIIFERTDYAAVKKIMNSIHLAQNKALAMGLMILPNRPYHYIESFSIFRKDKYRHNKRYYDEEEYRLRRISQKQEMRERVLNLGKDEHLLNGRPQSGAPSLNNQGCEKLRSLDDQGMLKFLNEVSRRPWRIAVRLLYQL
jgi:hypothetical protein